MSKTAADVLLDVAYRRYENSSPTDANEAARRLSYLSSAYKYVMNKELWSFAKTYSSDTPIAKKATYTLPTLLRVLLSVRVDGDIYSPLLDSQAFDFETTPVPTYWGDNQYFIFNNEITFIPEFSTGDVPSSVTVSSITRSGSLATITTSSAHGYNFDDFVTISGADQTEYNTTFRIVSSPSTTTFTVTVSGTPTTPATGTITVIKRPIVYHYFQHPADITATTDTFLIPDQYIDVLSAYVSGRIFQIEGARGKATDSFDEAEEIIKTMRSDKLAADIYNKSTLPNAYNFENYRY